MICRWNGQLCLLSTHCGHKNPPALLTTEGALMVEVRFGGWCCFCGKEMQDNQTDPCEVVVTTSAGGTQVWWCHAECFKERITDPVEAPGFFAPAHF
jgi:hypothetical protein